MKIIVAITTLILLNGCTTVETKSGFNLTMSVIAPGSWYGVVNSTHQIKNKFKEITQ